jgi:hypothetical protein
MVIREHSSNGRDAFFVVNAKVLSPGSDSSFSHSYMEVGSITSTIYLQVVGGIEKGTQCLGV